jgi:hypothetical protein
MFDTRSNASNQADIVAAMQGRREEAKESEPTVEVESPDGTDEVNASTEHESQDTSEDYSNDDYEATEEAEELDNQPEKYTVKVNGEELEVDIDELKGGYQRDSDYRKKTMAVAEERKAVEADKAEIAARIDKLESLIKTEDEQVDWDYLKDNDPAQYVKLKDQHDERKAVLEEERTKQQAEYEKQRTEYINTESQLLAEKMGATWVDDKRKETFTKAQTYLTELGVKPEELSQLADHRLWYAIFEAAEYAEFKKTKGRVKEELTKAPKSVKPGQKVAPSQRKLDDAYKGIQKSNKHNEAQALVEAMKAKRKQR